MIQMTTDFARRSSRLASGFILLLVLALSFAKEGAATTLQVTLGSQIEAPISGRLLVFAQRLPEAPDGAAGQLPTSVEVDLLAARATLVAALEVKDFKPGTSLAFDADQIAFPEAFSRAPAGRYAVQAVFDQTHSFSYHAARGPGDIVSPVVEMPLPAGGAITLTQVMPETTREQAIASLPPELQTRILEALPHTAEIMFQSRTLTRFWGRPITMRGWVLLPPGYQDTGKTYPTVYFTHGFEGDLDGMVPTLAYVNQAMATGRMPPMIWVFLDHRTATGTVEFADSVNNGPWGEALTQELIPDLERRYRMDARPSSRLLNGHSSGGWASLWLQTRYPSLFGGCWSTSPDPVDFHDFANVDLLAPRSNFYVARDGGPAAAARAHGQVILQTRDLAHLEAVLGDYGDQISSFEWVFSPRGEDGRPMRLFDRETGAVDPFVAAYWEKTYDLTAMISHDWPALKASLNGKIHVIVGSDDTFYLDDPVRRLKSTLDGLGARSSFEFIPDRTHFDLYKIGDDDQGLLTRIAREMYAAARPAAANKRVTPGYSH